MRTSSSGAPSSSKYIVQTADASLPNAQVLGSLGTGILKNTTGTGALSIATAGVDYLTSLSGAVLTDQTSGQTIGATGARLTKLWATDITVTNAIAGSVTGNAATVTTNANLTGPVTSTGNATAIANGAISNAMLANSAVANLSGTNTGDQTNISGNAGTASAVAVGGITGLGTGVATALAINIGTSGAIVLNTVTALSSLVTHGTITSGGLGTGAVIAGVTMTLGSDASGDVYYRNSSGVLTRVAAGAQNTVFTMGGSSVPSWAAAAAGGAPTVMTYVSNFPSTTRTPGDTSGGTYATGGDGAEFDTTATGNRYAGAYEYLANASGDDMIRNGSPLVSFFINTWAPGTACQSLFSVGQPTVTGTSITYSGKCVGFAITRTASGNSNLVATQGDGTTQNVSATLTTISNTATDSIDLIFKVNGTSSVDYYYRKSGATLSSATNLTSNIPSGVTGKLYAVLNNKNTATDCQMIVGSWSYIR